MKAATAYRRAAEAIDSGEETVSCLAIDNVQGVDGGDFTPATKAYRNAFGEEFHRAYPNEQYMSIRQFEDVRREGLNPREVRILALLFAAEMAKTGDL